MNVELIDRLKACSATRNYSLASTKFTILRERRVSEGIKRSFNYKLGGLNHFRQWRRSAIYQGVGTAVIY